jgi:hypothetical protein
MIFKAYKQNNDQADLINSIERVYKKATGAVAPAAPKEDPDKKVLDTLGLNQEVIDFAKSKLDQKDKKMMTMLKCYKMNEDKSDLENTISRYF